MSSHNDRQIDPRDYWIDSDLGCDPAGLRAYADRIKQRVRDGDVNNLSLYEIAERFGIAADQNEKQQDAADQLQAQEMSRDDVMRETVQHCRRVGLYILQCTEELNNRAINHDVSIFRPDEFDLFAQETPGLRELEYDSEEYRAALDRLRPALVRHYAGNRHHPDYHDGGVESMNLLDLIEMLADWKAAAERQVRGSLAKSIKLNAKRFDYGDDIENLLMVTARDLGWIPDPERYPRYQEPVPAGPAAPEKGGA